MKPSILKRSLGQNQHIEAITIIMPYPCRCGVISNIKNKATSMIAHTEYSINSQNLSTTFKHYQVLEVIDSSEHYGFSVRPLRADGNPQ